MCTHEKRILKVDGGTSQKFAIALKLETLIAIFSLSAALNKLKLVQIFVHTLRQRQTQTWITNPNKTKQLPLTSKSLSANCCLRLLETHSMTLIDLKSLLMQFWLLFYLFIEHNILLPKWLVSKICLNFNFKAQLALVFMSANGLTINPS